MKIHPEDVVFEGGQFVIVNISDKLKRHKNFPGGSSDVQKPNGKPAVRGSYYRIENRVIEELYIHQTAGSTRLGGFEAVEATNNFFIRPPAWTKDGRWTGMGRGWPGFGYTFYLPFRPLVYNRKWVIFQVWEHDWVTWHSSDNRSSAALALQGYFKSRHMRRFKPRGYGNEKGEPSDAQIVAMEGFVHEYAIGHLNIPQTQIKGHADSPYPKKTCPGDTVETFYRKVQTGSTLPEMPIPDFLTMPFIPSMVELDKWVERQAALVLLGHNLGNYGPKGNGVDGDPGDLTRLAIEAEEERLGLKKDGYWDDVLDYHLKLQLLMMSKTQDDIDALT